MENKNPAYSVYTDDDYMMEASKCWWAYSRKYLLEIQRPQPTRIPFIKKSVVELLGNIKTVADLGCGCGWTTVGIKQIWPKAIVYGTNVSEGVQLETASKLGVKIKPQVDGPVDLLVAFEYFEHFQEPIKHLVDVVSISRPRHLLIANTFTQMAIGHFNMYLHDGVEYHGKQISKLFNNKMLELGYEKVETRLWNHRPTWWRLKK